MQGRVKGILVGLFVLFVPALAVLYVNYYMKVLHPERLARGTTATVITREEMPDGFAIHYKVDDAKAAPVFKRIYKTDDTTYQVKNADTDSKDWQQLKPGDRFCIVYTESGDPEFRREMHGGQDRKQLN